METDTFLTIESLSEGLYKEKGSRFLAFAHPVQDEEGIQLILESTRKKYHDARHHCYAWRLGADLAHFRVNDDGEPTNSAGKPILGQIQSFQLTNVLIIVVRYFGGTLLGVGGLIQAYKSASMEALKNAKIIEQHLFFTCSMNFLYDDLGHVMKVLKDMDLQQWDQRFELDCELKLKVRKSQFTKLSDAFRPDGSVKINVLQPA